MSDITMCNSEHCHMKDKCYRASAKSQTSLHKVGQILSIHVTKIVGMKILCWTNEWRKRKENKNCTM